MPAGTQTIASAPAATLERIVVAAEDYLTTGADPVLEQLCRAVNLARRGVAEHDWGEWRAAYRVPSGEARSRRCQTCGWADVEYLSKLDGGDE